MATQLWDTTQHWKQLAWDIHNFLKTNHTPEEMTEKLKELEQLAWQEYNDLNQEFY